MTILRRLETHQCIGYIGSISVGKDEASAKAPATQPPRMSMTYMACSLAKWRCVLGEGHTLSPTSCHAFLGLPAWDCTVLSPDLHHAHANLRPPPPPTTSHVHATCHPVLPRALGARWGMRGGLWVGPGQVWGWFLGCLSGKIAKWGQGSSSIARTHTWGHFRVPPFVGAPANKNLKGSNSTFLRTGVPYG